MRTGLVHQSRVDVLDVITKIIYSFVVGGCSIRCHRRYWQLAACHAQRRWHDAADLLQADAARRSHHGHDSIDVTPLFHYREHGRAGKLHDYCSHAALWERAASYISGQANWRRIATYG